MTTFLLIRHAETDAVGKVLAGWSPGWHLNARGQHQVQRLVERLKSITIQAVYTSPLERAVETAEPIARMHRVELRKADELGEMRVGEWEGHTFRELDVREDWRVFNTFRTGARPPGGELMIETQQRMIRELHCLGERHADETVAVVSHCDPLRAAIAYFLGMPLDWVLRLEISTASLSVIQFAKWGARVMCVNQTEEMPL